MPTNIERGYSRYGRDRFMRVKTRDHDGAVTVTRELYGTLSQAKKARRMRRDLRRMVTMPHEALLPLK